MNVQDIVNTISNQVNIDPATTEKVVGTVLSVIQHETDGTGAANLFAKLPGAAELAQKYDVMAAGQASGGGLLGSLQSALGGAMGEKTGALVNGLSQLQASGLTMAEIQQAGTMLVQEARAAAGPNVVNEVLDQIPSLKGHLGLTA
jgi:hypothetical protein